MLNKGDVAVYGNHGLCKVSDMMVPSFLPKGSEKMYYQMISAIDRGGVLYVPVDGAEDKMREVISAEAADELIGSLEDMEVIELPVGKKAETVISDVCKKNEAGEVMSLIKTLYMIKSQRAAEGKKFSSMDEKYLGIAEKLLYSELAYAMDLEWDVVRGRITDTLSALSVGN
ncbi:CarD family transcriptional regulator [Butyrivibrio sp. MC2013]|uniref:CarD family transcriptional regulator n=1 Tax=Butyrivibrio sp. MC2013 TaxID=1280686 RepID=UPI00040B382D|nr:CarD family transcriptional regulator [Butyrivibrio sp. MC2013]